MSILLPPNKPIIEPIIGPIFATSGGGGGGVNLLNSLYGYWPMQEASGTRDESLDRFDPNHLNLTEVNTVGQNSGPGAVGQPGEYAAEFIAGNNEHLYDIPHNSLTDVGYGASRWEDGFTSAGWAYFDRADWFPGGNHGFHAWRSGAGPGFYALVYGHTEGLMGFGMNDVDQNFKSVTAPGLVVRTWQHFAFMGDPSNGGSIKIAINGVVVGETSDVTNGKLWIWNGNTLYWGKTYNYNMQSTTHRMTEWGLWHRCLNSDELAALYNNGTPISFGDFT